MSLNTSMPVSDPIASTRSGRPRLVFVSAVARNGVIGINNSLPWRLPEDLAFFKKTTLGHPVLMGRATFESIGRALPGRTNLVLTRDAAWQPPASTRPADVNNTRLVVCRSLVDAFEQVPAGKDLFVIGGAQIYETLLVDADSLILTEIDSDFAGDAHFPDWNRGAYTEVSREQHHKPAQENQPAFDYAFVRYDRKNANVI